MAKRYKGLPNVPFAPLVAALFGLVTAILVFATPTWLLERTVVSAGIADIFAAARPPLGDTARTLLALALGLAIGSFLWVLLHLIETALVKRRMRPAVSPEFDEEDNEAESLDTPSLASPRLLGRKPIFAEAELGAPLMSDAALTAGGELFLETAMIEAPSAREPVSGTVTEWMMPVVEPEDQVLEIKAPSAAEVSLTASPFENEPHENLGEEPTLNDLLNRFEMALKRRDAKAAVGAVPRATVASLRDLISASNLR